MLLYSTGYLITTNTTKNIVTANTGTKRHDIRRSSEQHDSKTTITTTKQHDSTVKCSREVAKHQVQ